MTLHHKNTSGCDTHSPAIDDLRNWVKSQWNHLARFLPERIDELAKEHRAAAFQPHSKIGRSTTLVHLVCLWAVGSFSLQICSAFAKACGLASVSAPALQKRFQRMRAFLEAIVAHLMAHRPGKQELGLLGRWKVLLFDATDVSTATHTVKMHWAIDLADLSIHEVVFSPEHPRSGETFANFAIEPGQLCLGDRRYCMAGRIAEIVVRGADVLVRYSRNVPLYADPDKQERLTPAQLVRSATKTAVQETEAWMVPKGGRAVPVRVLAKKLSKDAHKRQIDQLRRSKVKETNESRYFSGYLVMVTTAPKDELNACDALVLYRMRWQIENFQYGYIGKTPLIRSAETGETGTTSGMRTRPTDREASCRTTRPNYRRNCTAA